MKILKVKVFQQDIINPERYKAIFDVVHPKYSTNRVCEIYSNSRTFITKLSKQIAKDNGISSLNIHTVFKQSR